MDVHCDSHGHGHLYFNGDLDQDLNTDTDRKCHFHMDTHPNLQPDRNFDSN